MEECCRIFNRTVAAAHLCNALFLLEKLRYYDDYVKEGRYTNDTIFTHFEERFYELHGKTLGIIGLGNIGRRVASIAEAFGLNVIYASPSGSAPQDGYHQVDMDNFACLFRYYLRTRAAQCANGKSD